MLGRDCSWEFHHNHLSFKINEATPELLVGPLIQEVVSQTASAVGSGAAAAKSGGAQRHSSNDRDDGDDSENDEHSNKVQPQPQEEALNDEDRAALVDLYESLLLGDKKNTADDNNKQKCLTELQFHNFLAASGVTDEEKDLTLKRLKELRPNVAEVGIDF